jgi:hypothetical protein
VSSDSVADLKGEECLAGKALARKQAQEGRRPFGDLPFAALAAETRDKPFLRVWARSALAVGGVQHAVVVVLVEAEIDPEAIAQAE